MGAGSRALQKAATALGFGQKSGIEIGWEESVGLVGDEDWAAAGRGWAEPGTTPWIPEDMASASIGQSVVQITPLQLARAYSVFANGGWLVTPHLADQGLDWTDASRRTKVDMKPSTLAKNTRRSAQGGVGWHWVWPERPGIPPAGGKTGTAEDSTGVRPCLVCHLCPLSRRRNRDRGFCAEHAWGRVRACAADGQKSDGGMESQPWSNGGVGFVSA